MARYTETIGFIIHQRNYQDSSLILEVFSQENGLINILAKGIKKNKLLQKNLQYFSLLKVQYFGRSQLKTLSSLELIKQTNFKELLHQTSALYLNELLRYSLIENEPALELFSQYQETIDKISQYRLTTLLRNFEKAILKYNGFELDVSTFIEDSDWLSLSEAQGLYISNKENQDICQVIDLKRFVTGEILDKTCEKKINKLMHTAVDLCFSYKKIYSRELLKSITNK
jgi:DNA repair protein RecO (recombination protein O)